jgi:hypothetical protein
LVARLGRSDPASTLRHHVRLTTAARAKAVAGLDEVTRAALELAEEKIREDARLLEDNVVVLTSRRRQQGSGGYLETGAAPPRLPSATRSPGVPGRLARERYRRADGGL